MVARQLERIARSSRIDQVVVATSQEATDDELAAVLIERGVLVRRGPLDDVFARFSQVVDEFAPATVVRLTADCPLTDPGVLDDLVDLHLSSGADYSSNAIERTFPHGLDAECMKADVFARLNTLELTVDEREHVTLGIYSRPGEFTLSSLIQKPSWSHLRWTVDYPSDLTFVRAVYHALYEIDPAFDQSSIIQLLEERPDLVHTESNIEAPKDDTSG